VLEHSHVDLFEGPFVLDHSQAREHRVLFVARAATPRRLRFDPSVHVEGHLLPLVSKTVVVVESVVLLGKRGLLNKGRVDLIEEGQALLILELIKVSPGVVELVEFVIIYLAGNKTRGTLSVNIGDLFAQCADRIGLSQLEDTLIVGVALADAEGDEVERLFHSLGWDGQEEGHHGVKSN